MLLIALICIGMEFWWRGVIRGIMFSKRMGSVHWELFKLTAPFWVVDIVVHSWFIYSGYGFPVIIEGVGLLLSLYLACVRRLLFDDNHGGGQIYIMASHVSYVVTHLHLFSLVWAFGVRLFS